MEILKKLSVVSDGTNNHDWSLRLKQNECIVTEREVNDRLKIAHMPKYKIFEVTNGITTTIAVVKPKEFYNSFLFFKEASEKAGFRELNAEVACLLCEKIKKEDFHEMGINKITFMHKPFENVHLLEFFVLCVDENHPKPIFSIDCYAGNENPFNGSDEAFIWAI